MSTLDHTSPMITGSRPTATTSFHFEAEKRFHIEPATIIRMDDGTNIAAVATIAPTTPAACMPMSAVKIVVGPGTSLPMV